MLNELVEFAWELASKERKQRQLLQHLFLFGVEIGRGQQLTPQERSAYGKTRPTAEALILRDRPFSSSPSDADPPGYAVRDALSNWLRMEPKLKQALRKYRRRKRSPLDEPPPKRTPTIRDLLSPHLYAIAKERPDVLDDPGIWYILDHLENFET